MGFADDMETTTGFTAVNPPLPHSLPTPAPSTGTKRKRESALKFYAVRIGKEPGIYHSWAECLDQVRGFPKAMFKSFTSLADAENFVNNEGDPTEKKAVTKYYGVRSGRNPGVYTSWQDVLDQITGWKGPKHKGFKTRSEAEQFQGDFAMLNFLSGWASHCKGDAAAAGESFAIAQKIDPTIKPPMAGQDTLAVMFDEKVKAQERAVQMAEERRSRALRVG